jgi:phosphoribosylformylglycinamidine cyclo-ligase
VLNVIRDFTVNGIVHITGGGFDGNVPRILPKGVRARVDPTSWPRPAVFDWVQRHGELSDAEMLRVFNCGIGMVLCVPHDQADDIAERLRAQGERAYHIGHVERRDENQAPLLLDPGFLSGAKEGGRG